MMDNTRDWNPWLIMQPSFGLLITAVLFLLRHVVKSAVKVSDALMELLRFFVLRLGDHQHNGALLPHTN